MSLGTAPSWIVLKFGGTSVATAARWATIADRAKALLPGHRVWIVASALAGVSNRLEEAIREALAAKTHEALDWIEREHERLADEAGLADLERRPSRHSSRRRGACSRECGSRVRLPRACGPACSRSASSPRRRSGWERSRVTGSGRTWSMRATSS